MASQIRLRPATLPATIPAVLLLLLTACGGPGGLPGHTFTRTTEDGVLRIVNSAVPRFEGELFTYEEVLTLQEDEREGSLLNAPRRVLTDDSGRYFVMDDGNNRIAVFGLTGRFEYAMGREGDGPGEWRGAVLQETHDGMLSLLDSGLNRLQRFQTDGRLLDVTPLPVGRNRGVVRYLILDGSRLLLLKAETSIMVGTPYATQLDATVFGAGGDTLWHYRPEPVLIGVRFTTTIRGARVDNPTPFVLGFHPSIDFHRRHGILVSEVTDPELKVFNDAGRLVRTIRLDLPVEAVNEEEKRQTRQYWDELLAGLPEPQRPFAQMQYDGLTFAENKGQWDSAAWDDLGYMWLSIPETTKSREAAGGRGLYRIVSPEGEYLGLTRRPPGNAAFYRDRLLVAFNDRGEGVQYVRVYRVRSAMPGLEYGVR